MVLTNPQHPEFIVAFRWRAVYKYYYFIIRGGLEDQADITERVLAEIKHG